MTSFDKQQLAKEFAEVINKHSMENESNTPDWVIGMFLVGCLEQFNFSICNRDNWYGGKQSILESEKGNKWPL